MIISIITAMDENRVIGLNNGLPWKLPSDMKWFRHHTMGKAIVMGRKTFESFGAKPLPKRQNIIVSHNENYVADGCDVVTSIEAALSVVKNTDEVMIIGGASFYAQTLELANRLYLTTVHTVVSGDAWFPEFDLNDWQVNFEERHEVDEKNPLAHTFRILERQSF
ncbi:Dihydrofolate reductase [hydrothermal vent metagenome]|uniref:dihydrofolate reductase n=1 Tax=hydrothermal vent metagenome TaxID=652676 RepID=A0A3B1AI02_9ZZZZ